MKKILEEIKKAEKEFPYDLDNNGEFYTVSGFWDCECRNNYIHSVGDETNCSRCGAVHDKQPDSRLNEILIMRPYLLLTKERRIAQRILCLNAVRIELRKRIFTSVDNMVQDFKDFTKEQRRKLDGH